MAQIHTQIIEAIEAWSPLEDELSWPEARFDALARAVFAHQFAHNAAYRRFCEGRGVTPDGLSSWREIPAVPTDVFKHVRLTTAAEGEEARTFRTSGTTVERRGEHHFATLDVYRAAIPGPFRRFCAPGAKRLNMLAIAPSPGTLPDSSLSFMLGEELGRFGNPFGSGFFVVAAEDESGAETGELTFDFDGLVEALDLVTRPTMVLGTAFGFVEFFDAVDERWELPAGSRIMETGGLKGRAREVDRDELYALFEARLGVPGERCVSEYSMTELSSQAYSDNLARGVDWAQGRLRVPPWVRLAIVDPATLEPYEEPGREGLIRWYDLANVDSVLAVQTSDLGVLDEEGGLQLFGRATDAELRGCSLTIEEIVHG